MPCFKPEGTCLIIWVINANILNFANCKYFLGYSKYVSDCILIPSWWIATSHSPFRNVTMNCANRAFSHYRKEQSCILIDLIKEYQGLKSTVMKVIDSVDSASVLKSIWKDHEDIRRTLSKVIRFSFEGFKSSLTWD